LPKPLSNNIAAILTPNYDYVVSEQLLASNIIDIAVIFTSKFDSKQLSVSNTIEALYYVNTE
ncbi:17888_t:CDS:1, partial [Dentiscutata erythropus]